LVILWLSTGEEGLCGQMVASELGDKVGDTNEKEKEEYFDRWFIKTDSTQPVKVFFNPNPIKTD
jgi:hypothetical protein